MVFPRLPIFTIGCADVLGAGAIAIATKSCTISSSKGPIGKIFTKNQADGEDELLRIYGCVGSLFGNIESEELPKDFPSILKSKSDSHDNSLNETLKRSISAESTSSHERSACAMVKSTYDWKELKPKQTLTAVFAVKSEDKGWFVWAKATSSRKMKKNREYPKTLSYVLASMKRKNGGGWEIDVGQKVGDGKWSGDAKLEAKKNNSRVGTLGNKIDTVEFWDKSINSQTKFFWETDSMLTSGASIGNYFKYDEPQSILHDIWVVQAEDKSEKAFSYSEWQGKSLIKQVVNMFENMELWQDTRSNAEILAGDYYAKLFGESNDRGGYDKVVAEKNRYFSERMPIPTIMSLSKTIDGWYRKWRLTGNTNCNCKGGYVLN